MRTKRISSSPKRVNSLQDTETSLPERFSGPAICSDNFNAFDSSFNPARITLTISGLTPGTQYQFQTWDSYSAANGVPNYTEVVSDGVSAGVTLINSTSGNADGGLGQFVIGTFAANSSTQTVAFNTGSGGAAWINAVQFRQFAGGGPSGPGIAVVPEADSRIGAWLLVALCSIGVIRRSRLRTA